MMIFLKKIPIGVASLFFIQIFSTLAYSVLYVTLVLFAVQGLHLSAAKANHIMANFIAFNFALHLLGGYLGGRYISFRGLFLIGMILQTLGCLLLATINSHYFMLGLSVFLVGSGMDLPCINCMLAQLFKPDDKRQEYAFLWNYSGMNIGFFVGVTIAGIYQIKQHFSLLFTLTSLSNLIALALVLIHWKKLKDVKTTLSELHSSHRIRQAVGLIVIVLIIGVIEGILSHALFSSEIILTLGILVFIAILILTYTQENKTKRNKLTAYCIFSVACLIFYILYELIPMALTLFLERNVDRHFLGRVIPTAWFLNINTLIIIFCCPLLAYVSSQFRKKGIPIHTPLFFSIELVLIGLAIIILPIGIYNANSLGLTSAFWLIMTYILLALAEIALSPIGYALVSELAPAHLRGILMGFWLLISGVAAVISKIFSNIALGPTQSISPLISNSSYSSTFLYLGLAGIISGIILFLYKDPMQKLMEY